MLFRLVTLLISGLCLLFLVFFLVQPHFHLATLKEGHGGAATSGNFLDTSCSAFEIPVVVIARNNPTMLRLLVRQLRDCFDARVIVVDDASDFAPMRGYLDSLTLDARVSVVRSITQIGPRGLFSDPPHPALLELPRFFALTDSDLRLSSDLPGNFLCVLAHLTQRLRVPKAGLALDLTDKERMWPSEDYYNSLTVWGWEDMFWSSAVTVPGWPALSALRVFNAQVDTIFAVYDKGQLNCLDHEYKHAPCFTARAVRVAGPFTAKHRPWYPEALARLERDELWASFGPPNGGTVSNMLRRMGFFGNTTEQASAFQCLALNATLLSYQRAEDIMAFKCPLEGHVGIPGRTMLLAHQKNSMLQWQEELKKK